MALAFEDFELDEETRELRRAGQPVELQPKVFDLLVYFAKNGSRLVTRQELLESVWDGVIVGDAAISRAVREVRRALADDGEAQRIVKTVHARGFRFVAEIRTAIASPTIAPTAMPIASAPLPAPVDDFVGRTSALRHFEALLGEVTSGSGRATVVLGEAGIGKSHALERFARLATERGIAIHVARCSEADGVPALWPWEQIVRSLASGVDLAAGSTELRAAANDVAPLLGGAQAEPDAQARFRLQDGCVRFVAEIAQTRPIALLFDDIHLADAGSLALLHHATSRLRGAPIAIVATMRERGGSGEPGLARAADALARGSARGALTLHGFDADEVATFVHRQTGDPPDPRAAESLRKWTGGNPLFLAHILDIVGAGGDGEIRSIRVPKVLREAVDASLEALSEDAIATLLTASVVGMEFRLAVVAKAMGRGADDLLDTVGEALEYRMVRRVPGRIDSFAFAHGLLRDALYERLGLGERARRHAVVGDAIAAIHGSAREDHVEELAHHFLRAAPAGRADEAVTYAALAGDHAAARASYEHAAILYRSALDALPLAPESAARRAQILVRLGSSLGRVGRLDEAGTAFADAADVESPLLEDVHDLRDSFRRIADRAPALTERFYAILFERHPQLAPLFGRRNTPTAQNQMFRETLMAVVDCLEDAPWLRSSLADLGARHVGFGVTSEMYPLVTECLLAALSETAGDDVWTADVADAWRRALDAISAMMIDGARAGERRAS